jgi:sugar lactone lactonase YvrE
MPSNQSSLLEVQTLLTGLAMGESPRWHDDRLWYSDWGAQEIITVDVDGNSEVVVRTQFGLPFCIDWLPDGRLLIVSGRENLLMRQEPDGSLVFMPICAPFPTRGGTRLLWTVVAIRTSTASPE